MGTPFKMSSFLLASALMFFGCNDTVDKGLATVEVSLIDAPADYESVMIDIQKVEINPTGNANGWLTPDGFQAGRVELLNLTNGNELLFGSVNIGPGYLRDIRLTLGSNNSVTVDGTEIPVDFTFPNQNEIRITLDEIITAGVNYKLIMDFDAARSVIDPANDGNYSLSPVVRVQMDALTGSISGEIGQTNFNSVVYAVKDYDTTSTYPNAAGAFQFRSIEPGIYDVIIQPSSSSGFSPILIEQVVSSVGRDTDLGKLNFTN